MKIRTGWTKLFGALSAASLLVLVANARLMQAQNANADKTPLAFEVATVKPCDPNQRIMVELRVYPGGRLVLHGHNLRELISDAFNIPAWQITGGDKWVDDQRFDIEAKPPEGSLNSITLGEYSNAGIQDARVRSMLQALLIERFHLKSHMEGTPGTVYLLKRGDGPLRLETPQMTLYTRSEDGTVAPTRGTYPTGDIGMVGGRPVSIHQTSMSQLALLLGEIQNAPVSDQTGLQGFYNFKSGIVLTKEDFQGGGPGHLLVDAVPEMGLKLVKTQGTVQKFVIDSAEMPVSN